VIDMEAMLFDLAEHLDHPLGDGLEAAVRERLSEGGAVVAGDRWPHRRLRMVLAVAAAVVVLTTAVLTIGPARHAIADWLGIGAVEVRHSGPTVPFATGPNTVPGAPATGTTVSNQEAAHRLAAARKHVGFTIVTPHSAAAGALAGVDVDTTHRAPLVVLRYSRFTIVEVGSSGDNGPVLRKMLGRAAVEDVTVAGVPGLWIRGAHEIGFIGRDGTFQSDTVRRSGPVLLWERGRVTYRIEGLLHLDEALAIARTLR
jgi:hypothetical protein